MTMFKASQRQKTVTFVEQSIKIDSMVKLLKEKDNDQGMVGPTGNHTTSDWSLWTKLCWKLSRNLTRVTNEQHQQMNDIKISNWDERNTTATAFSKAVPFRLSFRSMINGIPRLHLVNVEKSAKLGEWMVVSPKRTLLFSCRFNY